MQPSAQTRSARMSQAPQLAQLHPILQASQGRPSAPHIDYHRARQADTHGGCTLRHAHLERRLPTMHAVAEAQAMAPDVFATAPQLQQPGTDQQQVMYIPASDHASRTMLTPVLIPLTTVCTVDQRCDEVWRIVGCQC